MNLANPTQDKATADALAAASTSYAPYSTNYAGLALESTTGVVVAGRYAENAAYSPSMSPLQAALSQCNLADKDFKNGETVPVQTKPRITLHDGAQFATANESEI